MKSFQFFDATSADDELVSTYYQDGLVKTYPTCFRCGKYECGNENCNNTLIASQVATFISYLRLWKYIANSQFETVLIIEDDVELSDNSDLICKEFVKGKCLKKSGLSGEDPMLLRFGWALCEDHQSGKSFSFIDDVKMSNPCHAINKPMAELLLSNFKSIDTTVDVFQHRLSYEQRASKTGFPPIFSEKSWSTGEFESLIHPKQVRLDYLKTMGLEGTLSYARAKEKLRSHQSHTNYKQFLSVGHPNCGEAHTAKLFKKAGLVLGNGKMGEDGISSWKYAVIDEQNMQAPWKQTAIRENTWFEYVIQYLKDPRDVIPKIIQDDIHKPNLLEFRKKQIWTQFNIDITEFSNSLECAVASLIYWNKIIELQKPNFVYRVGIDELALFEFLKDTKLEEAFRRQAPQPIEQRPNTIVTVSDTSIPDVEICKITPHLLNQLNKHCLFYGYSDFSE